MSFNSKWLIASLFGVLLYIFIYLFFVMSQWRNEITEELKCENKKNNRKKVTIVGTTMLLPTFYSLNRNILALIFAGCAPARLCTTSCSSSSSIGPSSATSFSISGLLWELLLSWQRLFPASFATCTLFLLCSSPYELEL